jgi:hypothetical protein
VTNNLHWQDPIPHYPEPNTGEIEIEKFKVKLCRIPTTATFPTFEKSYMPWAGQTVEGYCKVRAILVEYIKQDLLNNLNKRVNAISLILSRTSLGNRQNLLSQLPDDHIPGTKIFLKRPYALLRLITVVPLFSMNRKFS